MNALIEQGILRPEQVEELQKELALDGFNTMASPVAVKASSFSESVERIALFGRYVQLEFLGQGGMARVYKAYDPSLARNVALKFVKVENPQYAHRLLQEARSQARIDHEHVCKIYETGEADGKPYIAMQYISGKTLGQLNESLPLLQKVELIRQVADGVHAAHQAGLIHRDLKPANILIEQRETGPEAYVMDFGLAREIQAPALTMTGLLVGTPSYMSPEQALGQTDKIDARTDIYSIGATLYELMTGRPPFEGPSTMDILMQIVEKEPVLPRKLRPSLPPDLQTTVLKCLDKNPDRRYATARALSEDLSRFLDGDPIRATSATWMYRTNKRIRKHPVVSGLLAAAFVGMIVLATIAGVIQSRSNQQATILQEFGATANGIEGIMRFAYLLPLHDVSPERQMVKDRIDSIRNRMAILGRIAQGPGHYAIGRGLMALQEYGEAKTHFELALNQYQYRQPEVLYAYGVTLTMSYQIELESITRIADKAQREIRTKEVEKNFRDPALSYVRLGSRSAESLEYAEAIVGFLDKRYEQAIESSQKATRKIPWLYESKRLEADCRRRIALDLRDAGKNPEALAAFKEAEKAYQSSVTKGMSDPLGYVGLCNVKSDILEVHGRVGGSGEDAFLTAKEACGNALLADPGNVDAFLALSSLHRTWASYLRMVEFAADLTAELQQAINAAQKAIELQPKNATAHKALGDAYFSLVQFVTERFRDPKITVQASDESYQKAVDINPNDAYTYSARGRLFWVYAQYLKDVGKDPREAFDLSSRFLQTAIRLNSSYFGVYQQLGNTLWTKGQYEAEIGLDPTINLDSSLSALQKAAELNPGFRSTQMSRGFAAIVKGEYLMTVGRSPKEPFQLANEAYRQALKIHPNFSFAVKGLAHVAWRWGEFEVDTKSDPSSNVKAARSALDQCLALDRSNRDCYFIYGQVELVAARWKILRHEDPEFEFKSALQWLDRAVELTAPVPNLDAWLSKAHVARHWAEWKVSSGKNAEKEIRLGFEAVFKSIELNPRSSEMIITRGLFYLLQARSTRNMTQRKNFAGLAAKNIQEGLKLNANLTHGFAHYLTEAQVLLGS